MASEFGANNWKWKLELVLTFSTKLIWELYILTVYFLNVYFLKQNYWQTVKRLDNLLTGTQYQCVSKSLYLVPDGLLYIYAIEVPLAARYV
jgi:hypothetical protein